MTTSSKCSVLKDVVAYVDVWSSDKTANYSNPFIQQLQDMGAQVSKTFTKQVTHVVFNNGHPATWRKAKKSHVKLVSVLWVGRCNDEGTHVDEELYPALDETNPLLKNKKHRCMQPKDSPERTPENDRRMRKKLDKMMKDLIPKQPLVTDVSPIIIDEENGIVYSPGLKRSDYMAQRLKDMKEKRENLSPTASQMIESCSPSTMKLSLGSTPTVLKLTFDQSDDDSCASAAEPAYSPDKEEVRTQYDVTEPDHLEKRHRNASEKPWMSTCHDMPKWISSSSKCLAFSQTEEEKGNTLKKSRMTSVRKKSAEKHKQKSTGLSESPCQEPDSSKNLKKEKRQSQIKSSRPSNDKFEKGKQKIEAVTSITDSKTHFLPDTVNSSSCLSSPAKLDNAAVDLPKETSAALQKIEQKTSKLARMSLSSLVQSFTPSGDFKSAALSSADGDDNVFEDYFSPANCQKKSKRPLWPDIPVERDVHIPFKLDCVPKKRKQRRSESTGSETNCKKEKLEESRRGKNCEQQCDAGTEPQSHPQKDAKESLTCPSANVTLVAKRRRQSTLLFTSSATTSHAVKQRRASASSLSAVLTGDDTTVEPQKNPNASVCSYTLESE